MSYDTLKIRRAEALASINRQIHKGDALFTKGQALIKEKGSHNLSRETGTSFNPPSLSE
jgi:hypothetical protein